MLCYARFEPQHFMAIFIGLFILALLALLVAAVVTPAEDQPGIASDLLFLLQFGTPMIVLLITKKLLTALLEEKT